VNVQYKLKWLMVFLECEACPWTSKEFIFF